MAKLTEKEIREYLQDCTPADNDGLDLAFTSEQIASAMRRAARAFNGIPPTIIKVDGDNLPNDTNMFLDATIVQLFIMELNRLTRLDIEYSAGGVQVSGEKVRIAHLKDLIKFHTDLFEAVARPYKIARNLARGFRHFR